MQAWADWNTGCHKEPVPSTALCAFPGLGGAADGEPGFMAWATLGAVCRPEATGVPRQASPVLLPGLSPGGPLVSLGSDSGAASEGSDVVEGHRAGAWRPGLPVHLPLGDLSNGDAGTAEGCADMPPKVKVGQPPAEEAAAGSSGHHPEPWLQDTWRMSSAPFSLRRLVLVRLWGLWK